MNAVLDALDSMPRPRRRDLEVVREAVRRAVRAAIDEAWGKKPVCTVLRHGRMTARMIGRLNHVAIAVPDLAAATRALSRHARRHGVRAGAAARPRRHHRLRRSAEHQGRADRAARRGLADRRLPRAQPRRRHPPSSATRSTTSQRPAATARREGRPHPRRRRAEDRRARQAGGLPPPEGLPRHADRAGTGVIRAMRIGSLIAIYFVVWWIVLFAVLPFGRAHPGGGGRRRARHRRERARHARCSSARRSSPRSSRRSGRVLSGWRSSATGSAVEGSRGSLRARRAAPIKKARPFGLASSSSAS